MGGAGNAAVGALFFFGGIVITIVTYSGAEGGGTYVVAWGAILFGGIQMIRGLVAMNDERGQADDEDYAYSTPPAPAVAADGTTSAQMIEGYISADDYPARAMREEREGTTVVGFTVDTAGGVEDVHVHQSSGHEDLDRAAVRAVEQRFRFTPALDAEGAAISQPRTQSIRWQLG